LKLKSIEQAGRWFVSIAQMNRNLSIPSKVRVSAHLSDWKLRIEVESWWSTWEHHITNSSQKVASNRKGGAMIVTPPFLF